MDSKNKISRKKGLIFVRNIYLQVHLEKENMSVHEIFGGSKVINKKATTNHDYIQRLISNFIVPLKSRSISGRDTINLGTKNETRT